MSCALDVSKKVATLFTFRKGSWESLKDMLLDSLLVKQGFFLEWCQEPYHDLISIAQAKQAWLVK